ncbi:MAG TPA: hypothetical protein VFD30_05470 [Terriglobia bacterium]|jgi:hypothetical protein|nr:hypothetical protein [Terriglobia bacterium]
MSFEDVGRTVDREIAKLRDLLDDKVKPETRSEMARLLRQASKRLEKLAERLEKSKR